MDKTSAETLKVTVNISDEIDLSIQEMQLEYRKQGKGKKSKSEICLELIKEGLEARKAKDGN